ncbi:hypothetical protein HB364_30380 [Pseudoflavitalea sp. X16]|uniref:hypothetical protein n=1 Tax=Paraflavitalea devenefica TaxID=2716334 RepID=UPI00141DF4CC|nr:hypothetical protein [Paraflavitalea devenefica]NII29426.1 hypothetical protein [Paraflavitalea devenefica]
MKSIIYRNLLLWSILLPATACKKSNDNKNAGPGVILVKSATHTVGPATSHFELEYDNKGRIILEKVEGKQYLKLAYAGNMITWTQYNSNGSLVDSSIITLDASGLATSRKSWAANGSITTATYQYNNGYLFKSTIVAGSSTSTTTYYRYAGNLDSTKSSNGDTYIYEYYPDKKSTLENENNGLAFLGKGNSHPVKKETYKSGNTTTVVSHGYEYDSQGRIIKRISSNGALLNDIIYY